MLTERKHIALLGAVAATLALPAAASAAGNAHSDAGNAHSATGREHLPPRVRLRADAADHAADRGGAPHPGAIGIGDAKALAGPLLDPVDRFSALIATTTQRTEHRHKVHAKKKREAKEAKLEAKEAQEEEAQFAQLPGGVSMATLEAIAACESGGDPTAVSPEGTYMGLYQFDQGTWESVGGTGSPLEASAAEQSYRAALLYTESGSSPWPICGQ